MENGPNHIAIIMDGNGRWAKEKGLPRVSGHKKAVDVVRNIIERSVHLGIKSLTLFAFSSENWSRPKEEVSFLMSLFFKVLNQEVNKLNKNGIKLKIIGNRELLSDRIIQLINSAEKITKNNNILNLNVAINYGGRQDIVNSAKKIISLGFKPEDITEELFSKYLSLNEQTDPDLLIRTSGEQRISNFLLWQLSYSELYFTDVYWPDFSVEEFDKAIEVYKSRQRRYGGVK